MRSVSNYQEILMLRLDIIKQSQTSPSFAAFNANKIKNFFQQNNMVLKLADEKLQTMMDMHLAKDDNGKFKTDTEGKFIGITENDYTEYKQKYDELMLRTCYLEL